MVISLSAWKQWEESENSRENHRVTARYSYHSRPSCPQPSCPQPSYSPQLTFLHGNDESEKQWGNVLQYVPWIWAWQLTAAASRRWVCLPAINMRDWWFHPLKWWEMTDLERPLSLEKPAPWDISDSMVWAPSDGRRNEDSIQDRQVDRTRSGKYFERVSLQKG